jgi:hypothetical protein
MPASEAEAGYIIMTSLPITRSRRHHYPYRDVAHNRAHRDAQELHPQLGLQHNWRSTQSYFGLEVLAVLEALEPQEHDDNAVRHSSGRYGNHLPQDRPGARPIHSRLDLLPRTSLPEAQRKRSERQSLLREG